MSFVIPVEGAKNKFAIGLGRTLAVVTWDGVSKMVSNVEKLGDVDNEPDTLGNRLNDAKADPSGRLWLGTMGPEPVYGHVEPKKGSLYSFGPDKSFKRHLTKITVSNGLAWNEALKKFYYIDSPERTIVQFDFDITAGTICKH